jgi:CIC family chloride channel protein
VKPLIGGLGVGVMALLFPHVMGVGYESINLALHGHLIWYFAVILLFAKIVATSVTLGSGGSGGIFAPSLFMGAMTGLAFGWVVHQFFPTITAEPGAYALVAMGGLVAGTTRAPITAIIIVFELTSDYQIILPLMVTCIISMIVSSKLTRESIYTLKLVLRNIGIREGTEVNIMESIFVKDVYEKEFTYINATDNFNLIVNKIIQGRGREFPVLDNNGNLLGVITVDMIKDYLFETDTLGNVLIATDILSPKIKTVSPEDNCQVATEIMRELDFESIPVVETEGSRKVIGVIRTKDIQDAYNREVERLDITSTLASSITMSKKEQKIHFMEGYEIAEIVPPPSFIGKTIKELNIRARYGVDILSIKSNESETVQIKAIPSPDYMIGANDTLIVAGEIEKINHLQNIE